MKCSATFFRLGACQGRYSPRQCTWSTFVLDLYVNDMPVQVKHGPLLQFADDTCLLCCDNPNESVSKMLSDYLSSLSLQLDCCKSMWVSPVWCHLQLGQDITSTCVSGWIFNPQLSWNTHICKKMSYYLYLMNYHCHELPSHILKMVVDLCSFCLGPLFEGKFVNSTSYIICTIELSELLVVYDTMIMFQIVDVPFNNYHWTL